MRDAGVFDFCADVDIISAMELMAYLSIITQVDSAITF